VFMQSNGGAATPDIVCENPAALLISGPAAGPSMGLALAKEHKVENVVSVDMGGTSFDVGVVPEGKINVIQNRVIEGKKSLASVDVITVGTGGKHCLDRCCGRLQVGPDSAGVPGHLLQDGYGAYGHGPDQPATLTIT
jgi:N-methylhydantoinase A